MAAKRLSTLAGCAIALVSATAAWMTGGALTFTSPEHGATRIGLLPSPFWLAAAIAAALAACAITRSRSRHFALFTLTAIMAAPWMPGPVPAALYAWAGPLRVWLWAIVVLAWLVPALVRRTPRTLADAARDPRRAPWIAAAVAAASYCAGAYQLSPLIPTGDEPHYLVIAQSVLRDHDLQIENNHRRGDYRSYYGGDLRPDYLRRGINGEIYSVHAPGLPMLVAPVFALFGYAGVLVFLAIISAWATALTWKAVWHVTSNAAASWFGWAAAALSAPFFFQSFVVYPDAAGAALVMVGMLALVDTRTPASTGRLVATGAALALLPWLHTRYVAAAAMLGIALAVRLGTVRRVTAFLSVPAVSAACWFTFFYVIYGTPDPRAPYGGATQSEVGNLWRGIIGLLFDQQFGVLPAAPVLLCAVAGLGVLLRRSFRLALTLLLVITPYGLFVSAYQMWWGGNSSPGRFIVPILLPMAIPAGVWFHTRRSRAARFAGLGALAISLLITITLAGVERGQLVYNFRDGSSRLLTWLSPLVNITAGMPSVFQTSPTAALLHGLVWIAAVALTVGVGLLVERRGATGVPVAVSLGFASALAAAAALSVVWWDHGISVSAAAAETTAVTPGPATAALLRQFDPGSGQMAARYRPFRRVRLRDVLAQLTLAEATAEPGRHDSPGLTLFGLPAGVYAFEGAGPLSGPLAATVDGDLGPQWTWSPDPASGSWRRELSLPVPVRALAVRAPGARELRVRPVSIVEPSRRTWPREPRQVARQGPAVVFLLDGDAFMERGGTWVEGGRSADFLISAEPHAPVHLLIRNPPVGNRVTLEGAGWRQYLVLAPGEERLIALPFPPGAGSLAVRVTASRGARPIEFEQGSTDTRFLGCWVEPRP